jgi:hypothetical protein
MMITGSGGRVICDGIKDGQKCGRALNILVPPLPRGNAIQYWENVLQQALDSNWTYNCDSSEIFCPQCSKIMQSV